MAGGAISARSSSSASARPPRRPRACPGLLAPPFGTNALGDSGRTIVIILETDSIRANVAQQATSAAAEFVAGLSPRDWVGLVTMPYGGVLVEPTRDHARVAKVLPTITGQASQQTTDSAKGCRTRDTLTALAGHLSGLAHIEGPKTIIFVSSGMLSPRRDAPLTSAPGPCEIRSADFDAVGTAASLARANMYVVKPDDLVIDSAKNALVDPAASRFRSSDEELAGIESLAGVTSGADRHAQPDPAESRVIGSRSVSTVQDLLTAKNASARRTAIWGSASSASSAVKGFWRLNSVAIVCCASSATSPASLPESFGARAAVTWFRRSL